jgi:hypothetical protein
MDALAVQNIPEGKDWLYEVKFDGYLCLAGRDKGGVTLWLHRGNLAFPSWPRGVVRKKRCAVYGGGAGQLGGRSQQQPCPPRGNARWS